MSKSRKWIEGHFYGGVFVGMVGMFLMWLFGDVAGAVYAMVIFFTAEKVEGYFYK